MMNFYQVYTCRMCLCSCVIRNCYLSKKLLHHYRLSTSCTYKHDFKIETICSRKNKAAVEETLIYNIANQRVKCMHHFASSNCDKDHGKTRVNSRPSMSWQFRSHQGSTKSEGPSMSRQFATHQSSTKKDGPPWRILYFGTDEFSVTSLKALNENRLRIQNNSQQDPVVRTLEVVSNIGQTSVRQYANEQNLKVHDWPVHVLKDKYDVGVCVSFGHLIPRKIIEMFPFGILNVHPSILPRWRGANPIVHTILHGDKETGVSIMNMRPNHFDVGPLLMQVRYPMPERCTIRQLGDILSSKGANLLLKTLLDLPTLEPIDQDSTRVTYALKVKREMSFIDWSHQTVTDIDRQYRALHELLPLRTDWQGSPVKLLDMVEPRELRDLNLVNSSMMRPVSDDCFPGTPMYHKASKSLLIRCKDGWVGFRVLVFKKKMTALAFFNGYLSKGKNTGRIFNSESNQRHTNSIKMTLSDRS